MKFDGKLDLCWLKNKMQYFLQFPAAFIFEGMFFVLIWV